MHFAKYRIGGDRPGEILYGGFSMLDYDKQLGPDDVGEFDILLAQVTDADKQMVDGGQIVDRPFMETTVSKYEIAADGLDTAIVSSIPDGAKIRIGEQEPDATDGTLTLSSSLPGDFLVQISRWPYLDTNVLVIAR